MSNDELRKALQLAVDSARRAAALVRFHAAAISSDDVRFKGKNDLVTEVDVAAQNLIVGMITEVFPDDAILAEEEGSGDDRHAENRQWIIDPIDGTTNFTHGVPPYAVSIGMRAEGRMMLGVVYEVGRDELFAAARSQGLFVNGVRSGVSRTPVLADSLITTGFPYREFSHVDAYLTALREFMARTQGLRRPGSAAVDLAYVAAGRFDGFFETGLSPWDVAAGILLVEEGGGRVTSYSGADDPVFEPQIVASNGVIHDEMLAIVSPMQHVRV
jgi:myo-inositol-1(or 4)-monophosphatase